MIDGRDAAARSTFAADFKPRRDPRLLQGSFRGTFPRTSSFLLAVSGTVHEEAAMVFWPIVIAFGPGFVALYYDHDVKSFYDQSACERTLPELEQRARQAKEFMSALADAAGDEPATIRWRLRCIDKTPQEFQQHLEEQAD